MKAVVEMAASEYAHKSMLFREGAGCDVFVVEMAAHMSFPHQCDSCLQLLINGGGV